MPKKAKKEMSVDDELREVCEKRGGQWKKGKCVLPKKAEEDESEPDSDD